MTDGQPLCRSFFQNGSEEPSASRMAALMAELINQSERAAEWRVQGEQKNKKQERPGPPGLFPRGRLFAQKRAKSPEKTKERFCA